MSFLDALLGPVKASSGPSSGSPRSVYTPKASGGPSSFSASATKTEVLSEKDAYFFIKVLLKTLETQLPPQVKNVPHVKSNIEDLKRLKDTEETALRRKGYVDVDKAYKEQSRIAKNFDASYRKTWSYLQVHYKGVEKLVGNLYMLVKANWFFQQQNQTIQRFLKNLQENRIESAKHLLWVKAWKVPWETFEAEYFPHPSRTTPKSEELQKILLQLWNLYGTDTERHVDKEWLIERGLNQETD
jgi:hypothetical protein